MKDVKEMKVKLTKAFLKDLDDLERCAADCEHTRMRKTLERVSRNLRKHFGRGSQSGGVADLNDPAIYNISGAGLLNTGANPIDAGASGTALLQVPSPFHASASTMSAGSLFSEDIQGYYNPPSYGATGGAKKKRASKK